MSSIGKTSSTKNIAIIGGGINGVMSAWALAKRGHRVTLMERDTLMSHTSSASTKLLHGGLRYLENGEFRLVREALQERAWWLQQAPHLAHRLPLVLPLSPEGRAPLVLRAGLILYDLLAGQQGIGKHRKLSQQDAAQMLPQLRREHLQQGALLFFDGQMDDYALGLWAAERAMDAGVRMIERCRVNKIFANGSFESDLGADTVDAIVNIAGPWSQQLLQDSGLKGAHQLDLVRGSHLILNQSLNAGCFMQVPGERRIMFALPWKGQTLLGTTEQRQSLDEPTACSEKEQAYLLNNYAAYFANTPEVVSKFAGVRPLIRSAADPTKATREYAIETQGQIITVFGGKWTTSRQLGERVVEAVEHLT